MPVKSPDPDRLDVGSNILVPRGQLVGGTFRPTPRWRSTAQTGCAIACVTFRAKQPTTPTSWFGRPSAAQFVACTNPGAGMTVDQHA